MKIEYEAGKICYRPVYVSIDGTRHYDRGSAIRRDALVLSGTRNVEQTSIELPDEEIYMYCYNITCKEDWDYLYYTEWEQNIFGDKYTGPGWYGSIRQDGGDYDDSYEIIKIDSNYFKKYEDYIKELKDLTLIKSMV
jgi:hypothetical protein